MAGQPVGGDTRADVTTVVGSLAIGNTPRCPSRSLLVTSPSPRPRARSGMSVDEEATVDAVMDHGEDGFPVAGFFRWIWSYVSDSDVEPAVVGG